MHSRAMVLVLCTFTRWDLSHIKYMYYVYTSDSFLIISRTNFKYENKKILNNKEQQLLNMQPSIFVLLCEMCQDVKYHVHTSDTF